jgi:hypothetical protein
MEDIHLGMERAGFSISFLLDFSKVFDSMSHAFIILIFTIIFLQFY